MSREEIIEEALTYTLKDKRTGEAFIYKPTYDIKEDIIHIYTPVKPYKLIVLRRLLNIGKIPYKNIIIGYPDI